MRGSLTERELALPPLDTQQDLALAAVGKATAEGEITSEQAVHLAHLVDAARRTIDVRDAELRENHFWGRQRSPAPPPLPPAEADPDRADAARGLAPPMPAKQLGLPRAPLRKSVPRLT